MGLGLALLVNKITAGQRLLRTVIMFPMMFSPVLVGFQFSFLFNDNVGLVDNTLVSLGHHPQPIPFMVDSVPANLTILLAELWMSSSVFAILLLAGLFAMPRDPIEAAKVDGCNAAADLPLYHAALPDALRLHRHDDPLARCRPRLRHGAHHDQRRAGRAAPNCCGR